ncbi:cell division protein FtsX [Pinisolibacter sp.]|mgnify:CR=1 FL=1|uniref:cell division protein FtsX n=1 Tax=Pinisolibacter sp. TaxID=2172024 RepID=UPI002FDE10C0
MARDERPDPNRPAPPSPREVRASLSSSIGLGRGRGGRGGRSIEPDFDLPPPHLDDPGAAVPVGPAADFDPVASARSAEPEVSPDGARRGRPRRSAAPRRKSAKRRQEKRSAATETNGGRDIVPPQAIAGRALVLVVAIMGFLACLAVGGLSLVAEAARDWQLDVSREVTIQVKPIDGVAIEPRLKKATEIAEATRGVRSVRLIGERESEALLQPWLGSGLDLTALPIPRLVVLVLSDPAAADLAGLEARIGAEVRGATVDDHAVWAARLRTMAGTMVVGGFGVVVLMLVAMVLSVVFATRAAMAGNRDVIEVLHFVGAEDRFIAAEFQRHFLKLGLVGGAVGGAAAIAAFLVVDAATRVRGDALADQAHALFGGFSVGWSGHLGAVAVVALVAVLTAVTSRFTVLGHLGRLE